MNFEFTIKVTKMDEKSGNDKEVKETYLCENAEFFGEVEQKALDLCNGECDVTAIKISNVIEIINRKENDDDLYYKAKLAAVFVDDKGKEKETNYHVLCAAPNMDKANEIVKEYMKQGMSDLFLRSISETKILEII